MIGINLMMQLNATSLFYFVQVRTVLLGSQIVLLKTTKERLSGAVRFGSMLFCVWNAKKQTKSEKLKMGAYRTILDFQFPLLNLLEKKRNVSRVSLLKSLGTNRRMHPAHPVHPVGCQCLGTRLSISTGGNNLFL